MSGNGPGGGRGEDRDRYAGGPLRLALESSTRLGGVALGAGDRLLAESLLSVRASHSETVLPEVERLLDRCGVAPRALDEVVVGAGPGSFTGVRIAASLAKGLRAAAGCPLRAFSSLAAVAAGTGLSERVCVLLAARGEELYAAAWPEGPGPEPDLGPVVAGLDEVLGRLGGAAGWSFVGSAALTHRERLEEAGGRVLASLHAAPRPAALLWLAHAFPGAGAVADPATWEPDYVRASGAERGV